MAADGLIRVHGFPRSGSHLLMTLIARNFYPGVNLESPAGAVGHWADRQSVPPVEFGQLAGHHGPPSWGIEQPCVYVFRDARAVATSLYYSPHFKNPAWNGMTFSEFIREPLDWQWTVGNKASNPSNIIDHWREHLSIWYRQGVVKVRYENLVLQPARILDMLAVVFKLDRPDEWILPVESVGWFPSDNRVTGWIDKWSFDDQRWLFSRVPVGFFGLMENGGNDAQD